MHGTVLCQERKEIYLKTTDDFCNDGNSFDSFSCSFYVGISRIYFINKNTCINAYTRKFYGGVIQSNERAFFVTFISILTFRENQLERGNIACFLTLWNRNTFNMYMSCRWMWPIFEKFQNSISRKQKKETPYGSLSCSCQLCSTRNPSKCIESGVFN